MFYGIMQDFQHYLGLIFQFYCLLKAIKSFYRIIATQFYYIDLVSTLSNNIFTDLCY